MKHLLQFVVNCSSPNVFQELDEPVTVQIIGITEYNNNLLYHISDGKNFSPAFIKPNNDKYRLSQIIQFQKFYIKSYSIKNHTMPLIILFEPNIIGSSDHIIGTDITKCTYSPISVLASRDDIPIPESDQKYGRAIIFRKYTEMILINNDCEIKIDATFYDPTKTTIESNHVYLISKFSTKNNGDIKIFSDTEFKETNDDLSIRFKERKEPLDLTTEKNGLVDINGIIADVGPIQYKDDDTISRNITIATFEAKEGEKKSYMIKVELTNTYALLIKKTDEGKAFVGKCLAISMEDFHKHLKITSPTYIRICDNTYDYVKKYYKWYEENKNQPFINLSVPTMKTLKQIREEKLGINRKDYFVVDARLEQIEVYGVFIKFNKEMEKNQNNDNFIIDEEEECEDEDHKIIKKKSERAANYTLYYETCSDPKCEGYKKMKKLKKDNLGHRFCPVCNKSPEKARSVFQFDLAFSDDTMSKMFFRFKVFNQGIPQIILDQPCSKWKEDTDGMTKEEKRDYIKPYLHTWYRLEVEAFQEEDKEDKTAQILHFHYPFATLLIKNISPILDKKE